jgi:hypothetical protein
MVDSSFYHKNEKPSCLHAHKQYSLKVSIINYIRQKRLVATALFTKFYNIDFWYQGCGFHRK